MDGHTYTAKFEAPDGEPILKVYPDPLTGSVPWTVGLGHTGPDVHQGDIWTEERCWTAFYNDYAIATGHAAPIVGMSVYSPLSEPRRAVLTDLCFNPGPTRLSGFVHMLDAIRKSDWQRAHDELLNSEYAQQVHGRATTNAMVLLTGNWPEVITTGELNA